MGLVPKGSKGSLAEFLKEKKTVWLNCRFCLNSFEHESTNPGLVRMEIHRAQGLEPPLWPVSGHEGGGRGVKWEGNEGLQCCPPLPCVSPLSCARDCHPSAAEPLALRLEPIWQRRKPCESVDNCLQKVYDCYIFRFLWSWISLTA